MSGLETKMELNRKRRRELDKERAAVAKATRSLVRQGARRGWTKERIAAELGVSRQTVFEMLRDEEAKGK